MRAPPPVAIDTRAGPWWRATQAALHALAAGIAAAWTGLQVEAVPWAAAAACAVAGMAGAAAGWRLSRAAPARLAWSGQVWTWQQGGDGAQPAQAPQVMLDLGSWMLVRVPLAQGAPRWTAADRADAGPAWHAFRAAVYSSASGLASRSAAERTPL